MTRGRPLRFLALVIGGWVIVRAAISWPDEVGVSPMMAAAAPRKMFEEELRIEPLRRPIDVPAKSRASTAPSSARGEDRSAHPRSLASRGGPGFQRPARLGPGLRRGGASTTAIGLEAQGPGATGAIRTEPGEPTSAQAVPVFAAARAATSRSSAPRLHGDAWLVARPGGGENLAFGQLGASQAGVRVTYALDRARRFALSGRLSAPLRGRGSEAAAGLDWRPLPLPVHLLAEVRAPLDGGPALPAVQAIGGGAARLPLGLQLEGYAQAGAVSRRGPFADGAARVAHPVATAGRVRVDAGAGVWGAAQRRVARLDVGPTIGVALPVGRVAVRLGADYRFRAAGRARPGSGPAVTLGGSF